MDSYSGLSQREAEKLLTEYGRNEILDINRKSALKILLRQIKNNFVIYLLFAAAIISFLVGKDITAYAIWAVIIMVIMVGFIQEFRAEKAISSLRQMIMPVSIVRREGKEKQVPSAQLVPGDILILGNGERIPADSIILEERELRVDESVLTGESKDIRKIPPKTQEVTEDNMVFMGTFVVNGRCVAKVIHTGMNTRFGKIAGLISTAEKELPLQKKINHITRYMVVVAIAISILTGALMLITAESLTHESLTNIFILVIALSVSAFPEGFPVVLITTLATGAARMARHNAIVNRMSTIETLGETTVICTDKTGTLTRGEMTVKKIYISGKILDITGSGFRGEGEFLLNGKKIDIEKQEDLLLFFKCSILCNDTKIQRSGEDLEYRIIGAPTEGALLVMAAKREVFQEDIEGKRVEELPFSSDRKLMSVLWEEESKYTCFVKGAPEILLSRCTFIIEGGKIVRLDSKKKENILRINEEMNSSSFRTLGLAYKPIEKRIKDYKEEELIFLGLVGMEDPPREEVKEALALCFNAGIKVKMVTGDNKQTAVSISNQIGLTGEVIEGNDLDNLSDSELIARVKNIAIFTRVRPEHKIRIVKALKQNGEIVTMTGDGVNDAPALKEAHIGVAMGKNGTDVSRSVADLTLKDDNFATIVAAIKEGRTIFNNIRKFVSYQLSCNLAELAILFFGVLLSPFLGWQVPLLLALHILFMNLVTDNLPALTLGFNPSSHDIMRVNPRRSAQILNTRLVTLVLFNGGLMASLTLASYFVSYNILLQSVDVARTTALTTLILLEIASAFNFRSFRHKVFNRSPFVNRYLVFASIASICATLIILYTGARKVFDTTPLGIVDWAVVLVATFIILLIYDLLKHYSLKKKTLLSEVT